MLVGTRADDAAKATGLPAETDRAARQEFAAAEPEPGGGGRHRQPAPPAPPSSAPRSTCSTTSAGNVGQTVRFGADLDHGDGYGALEALLDGDGRPARSRCCWCTTPTRCTPLPSAAKFAEALAKVPFKVSTALFFDETAAASRPAACRATTRSSAGTTSTPASGVWGLMQPVHGAGVRHLAPGDILLKAAQKAGGALAKFTAASWEAQLKSTVAGVAFPGGDADVLARGAAARRRVPGSRRRAPVKLAPAPR